MAKECAGQPRVDRPRIRGAQASRMGHDYARAYAPTPVLPYTRHLRPAISQPRTAVVALRERHTDLQLIGTPTVSRLPTLPPFLLHCWPDGPTPDGVPLDPRLNLVPLENWRVQRRGQAGNVEYLSKRYQWCVRWKVHRGERREYWGALCNEGQVQEVALREVIYIRSNLKVCGERTMDIASLAGRYVRERIDEKT